jgi:CDP-6-deoxy-D-xylo-4-hexulose-3-dehydrase
MITITPVPATPERSNASTLPATGPTAPAANPPLDALRSQIAALVQQYADIAYAPQPFVPGVTPVPVSGKVIGARELQYMVDASLDGWLTTGRFNAAFEARLARFIGVKHVLTVNSGSSANLVAFSALTSPRLGARAIKPGDEVIGVAAGFPTTVNPIVQFGAVPVFVDVDLATHNIDASLIEAAIGPRTKAIMLAHSLGNPFNLDVVTALCRKYGLWLVEDCCDALGATYKGQMVGTFGDIGTLSFYPAHHITMGEGGAVFTNNDELKLIAESFRDWGRDCYCAPGKDNTCKKRFCQQFGELPFGYDHKYTYSHLGYNLKISDMQAACALAQMERVDEFVARRRANFAYLRNRLRSVEEFLHLPQATPGSEPSWFGFPLILKASAGVQRSDLINYLEQAKIGTRLLFAGNLTKQPYMIGRNFRVSGTLDNTDVVMNQTFWLGTFPALEQPQLDYIAQRLEEFFGLNF